MKKYQIAIITVCSLIIIATVAADLGFYFGCTKWIQWGYQSGLVREQEEGLYIGQNNPQTEVLVNLENIPAGKHFFLVKYRIDEGDENARITIRDTSRRSPDVTLLLNSRLREMGATIDNNYVGAYSIILDHNDPILINGIGFPLLLPFLQCSDERFFSGFALWGDAYKRIITIITMLIMLVIVSVGFRFGKREDDSDQGIFWFSLLFSLTVSLIVLFAYSVISRFNYNELLSTAVRQSMFSGESFHPEPRETGLFFLLLLVAPLSFAVGIKLGERLKRHTAIACNGNILKILCVALFIAWTLFVLLSRDAAYLIGYRYFKIYLADTIVSDSPLLYGFIALALAVLIVVAKSKNIHVRKGEWLLLIVVLIPVVLLSLPCSADSWYFGYIHFAAVFQSVAQVAHGYLPLCDGFINTYGLDALPLGALYSIFHSVYVVALFLALLNAACVLMIYDSFRRISIPGWLNTAIVVSIVWLSFILPRLYTRDIYYQFSPIRTFYPLLTFWIISKSGERIGKISSYISGLAIISTGFFWNLESTLVALIGYAATATIAIMDRNDLRGTIKKTVARWVLVPASLVLMASIYAGIVAIVSNETVDLISSFQAISQFGSLGYYNLGAPVIHPWNIYIILAFSAMFYIIWEKVLKKNDIRDWPVFYIAVVALGFLKYYQGRSHTHTFFNIIIFAAILVGWGCLRLLEKPIPEKATRRTTRFVMLMRIVPVALIAVIGLGSMIIETPKISSTVRYFSDSGTDSPVAYAKQITAFVDRTTKPGEEVVLLLRPGLSALVTGESKEKNGFNPNLIDLFTRTDFERLKTIIAEGKIKIYLDTELDEATMQESLKSFVHSVRGKPSANFGTIELYN